jgi:hypothetical protein
VFASILWFVCVNHGAISTFKAKKKRSKHARSAKISAARKSAVKEILDKIISSSEFINYYYK